MNRLEDAVQVLRRETGWTPRHDAASGRFSFALETQDFWLEAPDDRHLHVSCVLEKPSAAIDLNARARELATLAAGAMRRREAVLSFAEGAFHLHVDADLKLMEEADILALCQDFLNDCDWWRVACAGGAVAFVR
ncbi:MAG: hypothetical protein LBQ62_09865 [Candidatus Accumulibacter sp.]|jgi:hypothetical protein|nr:hypothetical protein [Accumulibacter sp.]